MAHGFHLEMVLDKIRETQWQQNTLLDAISRNQLRQQEILVELLNRRNGQVYTPSQKKALAPPKLSTFFRDLATRGVQTGMQWLGGSLAIAYVLRGGDISQLLQMVLKSFSQ